MDTGAEFVVLSDMHLGYDRSLLSVAAGRRELAEAIGEITGGRARRLVLNGDCFETCVPADTGADSYLGATPFVCDCARDFFLQLAKTTKVSTLIIVPGNHDWALWSSVLAVLGEGYRTFAHPTYLKEGRYTDPECAHLLNALFGDSLKSYFEIGLAHPVYYFGNQWPFCAFHHGHFLDSLVLGQDSAEKYHALRAIGTIAQPAVVLDDTTTLSGVNRQTNGFVRTLWSPNSRFQKLSWAVLRRDEAALHCACVPDTGHGPVAFEGFQSKLGRYLPWFIDMVLTDSGSPAPVGDRTKPSYLFLGHDHYGGKMETVGADGLLWRVINTGGWTDDGGAGIRPHGHVTAWMKGAPEPIIRAVRV